MKRKKIILDLVDYFAEKGNILSKREYINEKDTPHRAVALIRTFGSWSRLAKMVAREMPVIEEKVEEVIEEIKETKEEILKKALGKKYKGPTNEE